MEHKHRGALTYFCSGLTGMLVRPPTHSADQKKKVLDSTQRGGPDNSEPWISLFVA